MKNQLNTRIEAITPTTLVVGVDIAKEVHWARIIDYRGVDLSKPVKINNTINGFESLMERLAKLKKKRNCDKIVIAMEPSGHYWKALAWYLKAHEMRLEVAGVNPYHTKLTKELSDNSPTKSDKKDALVIANLVRNGEYFEMHLPEAEYAELRVLNSERQRLMKQISRANNTIIAIVDEYFPELETIWKPVTCATALAVLKLATFPSDVLEVPKEELATLIRRTSRKPGGESLAEELIEKSKRSIGVCEGKRATKFRLLKLIGELEFYEKSKKEVEDELEEIMDTMEIAENIREIKGIGVAISAAFFGEAGDIARFDNWKQVRKLAGLNLVEQSSGKHKGKTKSSKRGRPYLRYELYMAGVSCIMHNPEMQQYYSYLTNRKQNPLEYHEACVAVGLKMLRIMFYMAKTGEKYDPDKVLGKVRLQQINSLVA